MGKRFNGIFAALTSPIAGSDISVSKFKENIEKFNPTALAGYVILGSTGECMSLTDQESEALVRGATETAASGKAVIAGTARESTKLTVEFTNRMADLGADAALVRSPAYFKSRMTREALRGHFLTVADGSRIPVLLYNIPQNTGILLDSSLIIELSRHPNIIGLKDSSGNLALLGEVIREVPPDFHYFLGSGSVVLPALVMGACGAILAVANAAPEICVQVYEFFRAGRFEEARKLQLDLIPLNKAVTETIGVPGLKYALDLLGFYGGPPRAPLLLIDDKAKAEIVSHLKKLGMLPLS